MLELGRVTKRFGSVTAVDEVSLRVETGEFFALLGPSGCGKTTLLRTIAGIYPADGGVMRLDGADLGSRPMSARNIALVFQNYALFPHLSVFDNVAFGLRMRKVARPEIARRVAEALGLVRMTGFERRRPSELSGGQQQRVALARAVVVRPSLLLLDEPLSNLDAKLRDEMRDEIRGVQRSLGLTTVLVTHDLREAFAVSDRIAVMRDGALEQVGTPGGIYDDPRTRFVAGFIGHHNLFEGTVESVADGAVTLRSDDGLVLTAPAREKPWRTGGRAWGTIRPERVRFGDGAPGRNAFAGVVEDVAYLGSAVDLRVRVGGARLRALNANLGQSLPALGEAVTIGWNEGDLIAHPEEAGS
jgi:ABC-type Fe3+/spermidine/putrescine transport system ATPase subunit